MLSGKLLAYVLRHSPESVLLELDEHGRAPFHHVVAALRTTPSELQKVIDEDSKGRFIHSEGMLWAAHGHSVPLTPLAPLYEPQEGEIAYHGTSSRFVGSILKQGLQARGRQFVHLSRRREEAAEVGARHGGRLVMLSVDLYALHGAGGVVRLSEDGVLLTRNVSPDYLQVLS